MKIYKFSTTDEQLRNDSVFGGFNNSMVLYAICQTSNLYPNHMVERINYNYTRDAKGNNHNWEILLKTIEEFTNL